MDPYAVTEEYMCSAGVAHLRPLVGGNHVIYSGWTERERP